ncbi:MAG: 3-octaprenyl-4-hydroxybenzoate carboxy-lyase [Marinilabiliales bacterium]|nr:MAG: 3-octaprenyl-4-hydroxybenzoate carboxy-lyase [Marinilabiliales bacterium]
MKDAKRKIIIAITGASGSVYALNLINSVIAYPDNYSEIAIVFSEAGKKVWDYELKKQGLLKKNPIKYYKYNDLFASIASGSANYDSMVVIPCTMGTLGKIASGTSDNLIIRAADVMLKERRKLILVTRESPLSLIHIENMKTITLAGGIIMPASPTFYHFPESIQDLTLTVVERILDLLDLPGSIKRWE